MAELYKVATGWLGWSPRVALTTPIPQILLAQEGLVDWHKKLNGVEDPPEKPPLSERIKAAFRSMSSSTASAEPGVGACTEDTSEGSA